MHRLEKDSAFPMSLPLPAQLCSGVNITFWWSFGWPHSVPALFTHPLSSLADGSSLIMNLLLSNCIKAMEIGPFFPSAFPLCKQGGGNCGQEEMEEQFTGDCLPIRKSKCLARSPPSYRSIWNWNKARSEFLSHLCVKLVLRIYLP